MSKAFINQPMPVVCALTMAIAALFPASTYAQTSGDTAADAKNASNGADDATKKDDKNKLQTVTVTAERRSANIQKTSISMQAVSGTEISEQGLSSGSEILKNISNVEVQGAARGSIIAIRGVGSDMPPGMGESAVSTNYDGVYNFRAEDSALGFFDLDRVEVLRGPQGTLYGRNAASGAINYITRDPVIGQRGGDASVEIGSYNLRRSEVGFNIPVSETFALRASAASMSRDGYLSDGYDDAKADGMRLKALYKPNADLRLLVGVQKITESGKGVGMIPDANWENKSTRLTAATDSSNPGYETIGYQSYDATKIWAQLDANVGIGTLSVIPAFQKANGEVYRKWDASHLNAESWSYDPSPARQKSVETRLTSKAGTNLQWVAGLYYYDMRNVLLCMLNCQSAETVDTTNSKAVFGQATYTLAPSWRVIFGLRRTSDKKTNLDRPDGETWTSTDGKLGVEHDLGPSAMAYATFATAYRPGGFNTFNTTSPRFDAEHLRSVEIGAKSRLLDDTLQLNAALFQMNYKNYQAIDNYLNPSPTSTADTFLSTVHNVPHQTIRGLEMEAVARLETGTKLSASMTYLDAKIGDLVLHDFTTATEYSMEGDSLPHAPRTTLKAGVAHPFGVAGGSVTVRGDLRYITKQYVSISESSATLQPSYAQIDLSTQYRPDSDKWGINFYVKNATNYIPKTGEFYGYLTVGAPRTFGAVLTTTF